MATLKSEEIRKISAAERNKRLKTLKLELMKSSAGAGKSNNTKQIKKMIARIHTINKSLETKTSTGELNK